MKTIAAVCMLLDHIGMVFFPEQIGWRMIGRLAMPIFAYCLARGLFYTSSIKRYMQRLLIFAFVSQPPFWFLKWSAEGGRLINLDLNIGFTFLMAALVVYFWKSYFMGEQVTRMQKYKGLILGMGGIVLSDLVHMDYGSYGVLLIAGCYFVISQGRPYKMIYFIYTFLTLIYYGSQPGLFLLQLIGILGLVICYLFKNVSEKRLSRFFYLFYPLHMLALSIAKIV